MKHESASEKQIPVRFARRSNFKTNERQLSSEMQIQQKVAKIQLMEPRKQQLDFHQIQQTLSSSKIKEPVLPAQVFYNIEKKHQRRKLDDFSLHKYPGNFESIFIDLTDNRAEPQSIFLRKPGSQRMQNSKMQKAAVKSFTDGVNSSKGQTNAANTGHEFSSQTSVNQSPQQKYQPRQPESIFARFNSQDQKSMQNITVFQSHNQNDSINLPELRKYVNQTKDAQRNSSLDFKRQPSSNEVNFNTFRKRDSVEYRQNNFGIGDHNDASIRRENKSLNSQILMKVKNDYKDLKAQLNMSRQQQLARKSRITHYAAQLHPYKDKTAEGPQAPILHLMHPSPSIKGGMMHQTYFVKIAPMNEIASSDKGKPLTSVVLKASPNKHTRSNSKPRSLQSKDGNLLSSVDRSKQETLQSHLKLNNEYSGKITDQDPKSKHFSGTTSQGHVDGQLNEGQFSNRQFTNMIDKKFEKILPHHSDQVFDTEQAHQLYKIIQTQFARFEEQKAAKELRMRSTEIKQSFQRAAIKETVQEVTRSNSNETQVSKTTTKSVKQNASSSKSIKNLEDSQLSPKQSRRTRVDSKLSNNSHIIASAMLIHESQDQNSSPKTIKSKSPSTLRRKLTKKFTLLPESEKATKIDFSAIEEQMGENFFFSISTLKQPKVFLMLKNLKWDIEKRIARAKLVEGKDIRFPGSKEKFEATMKKYYDLMTQKYQYDQKRHAAIDSGEAIDVDIDMIDLKKLVEMHTSQKYQEELMQMVKKLYDEDADLGLLASMQEYKIKEKVRANEAESELKDYIKYLIGEQKNKEFLLKREDFDQKHELNTKSLLLPFEEYAMQEENAMKTVANDIIQRVDYNLVVHSYSDPCSIHVHKNNPKYAYFRICHADMELAVPLLAKVVNRQLCLSNYRLSLGHIKAFVKTFDFNSEFVNQFFLDNCGLSDQHNELLFTSFAKLQQVKELVLKQSELGLESIKVLIPTIHRQYPNNLRSLRIINCKISSQYSRMLVKELRQSNSLQTLALVNANLSDTTMLDIGLLLEESLYLVDLDLSWNLVKPKSYVNLIKALESNRVLKNLNLSWNRLVDDEIQQPPVTDQEGPWYEQRHEYDPQHKVLIDSLVVLIKRNKQLLHLNLTSTCLTEQMIVDLACALRRAKSLLSVHLCGNKGVTERSKEFMRTKIRAMPVFVQRTFRVSDVLNKASEHDEETLVKMQLARGGEDEGEKPVARESIKIKQILKRKRIYSKVHKFAEDADSSQKMILTRVLDHKRDIPGIGQWKVITDKRETCWICDLHIYGLIFWDPDIITQKFFLNSAKPWQASKMEKILSALHSNVCSKQEEDEVAAKYPNRPLIYGDFTNWKPVPMVEITELSEMFMNQLDPMVIIDKMVNERKCHNDATPETLTSKQQTWYNEKVAEFFYSSKFDWRHILAQKINYKKPHLTNGANTRKDYFNKLFVHVNFFTVGKHDYIVRTAGANPHYMYSTMISDIRTEEPPAFTKLSRHKQTLRVFSKINSVFAPWKEDNSSILKAAANTDFANWKIDRVIKNETDYLAVTKFILKHLEFLKEVYLQLAVNSSFPFVSVLELSVFCQDCQLIDATFKTAHNDLTFIATNAVTKGNIKNKSGLIRCEFFEFLIRVCDFKFIKTGLYTTYEAAMQHLVLEKMKPNLTLMEWQEFRDKELWTNDVNDVLKENLESIKKVYMFYQQPDHQYMNFKDCLNMMMRDSLLQFTAKQAKYCYGFSKMTNTDETDDFLKTDRISFVELLEMIGRIAHSKYLGTPQENEPLHQKIEHVLDLIFPMVGCTRKEVTRKVESESESDEDY